MDNKKNIPEVINNSDDVTIYNNNILLFADEYISNNNLPDKQSIKDSFLDMINYITIECGCRYKFDDLPNMKKVLNTYLLLCEKYNYIPDSYGFSKFIDSNTQDALKCDIYRVNSGDKRVSNDVKAFYKKTMDAFKQALVHTVTESRGADVNRIFILKAVHGMAETQPQTVESIQQAGAADILSNLGIESK